MRKIVIAMLFASMSYSISYGCTTAVISGKATPDGRPLLWKHRDSDNFNNKIKYFKGVRYSYIGLVNSDDSIAEIWGGTNSAGFSIINSASYNLKPKDDKTVISDMEGVIMRIALENCATVRDFKNLLDTLKKPWGVEANFGVIDTTGGAAYFEANNFKYTMYDANDPKVAPEGYLIRTNYSFSGRENEGAGYNRYITASAIIKEAYRSKKLSPEFFLSKASLSLRHELTKTDLANEFKKKENFTDRMYPLRDFIVRYSSTSTILVQGVKPGEKASLVTTWIKLGFQPTSVSIPLWVNTCDSIPSILTATGIENAKLCDFALTLKKNCFPYQKWSEGENYVYLEKLGNSENTGYMQLNAAFEKEIIIRSEKLLTKWRRIGFEADESYDFYKEINQFVKLYYSQNFNLN